MKRVQTILALALAGAMGSAAAIGPGDLGNLTGQTVNIGNSFAAGAAFNDEYIFDIMPESATVGTAVTINLDIPQFNGQEFAIENFSVAFKDSLNNIIASDFQTSLSDYTLSVFANLPAALDYKFAVSGSVIGTLGGSYGGVLQAVPVPETKTYAMMLAGLGLVGFTVLRRRRT
ncbi:MAG: FxDxF family PEP-CTERM protein [Thiobacillus sp.]|nr:FxDxF family PEP-CTERM protein [Thiobacillus sp.]